MKLKAIALVLASLVLLYTIQCGYSIQNSEDRLTTVTSSCVGPSCSNEVREEDPQADDIIIISPDDFPIY